MLRCYVGAVARLFLGIGSLAVLHVYAADCTLKASVSGMDFDWSNGENYDGGIAPSKEDWVSIPENVDARLSAASGSWTFVTNTIARVRPMTPTSRFIVDVPEGTVAELPCEVTVNAKNDYLSRGKGNMTKTGEGELKLSASGYYSYFSTLVVSNGVLSLLENGESETYYFDSLAVASNATLNAVGGKGLTRCHKFSGYGTIHGPGEGRLQTYESQTDASIFYGRFTGFTNDFLFAASPVYLYGTNSTATGVVKVMGAERDSIETGAALGLVSFAKEGDQWGTIGAKQLIQMGDETPGGVRYLGTGQTVSDFTFNLRGTGAGSFAFIDAGPYGGLCITNSRVETGMKSAAMHREFILTGSSASTNHFHCWLRERANDQKWCPFHLVKRGLCTWRLHENNRLDNPLTGGISVENGTLQYDTIADAGVFCSLGYATNLYEAYTGTLDPARKVPWAISLGTASGTQGTIEYVGAEDVCITNRIIALKGDGRILHNRETLFRFGGIMSDGADSKTLTLDGAGANRNQIMELSDESGGAISIAKKGSGVWELLPGVSFRGGLTVDEGVLNLYAPSWSWFRFVHRQGYVDEEKTTPSKKFKFREMAFFDSEGISRSIGLSFAENWRSVLPGQFAYAKDSGLSSGSWGGFFGDDYSSGSINLTTSPVLDNESTWMPLVFRMPVGAEAITSFDVVYDASSSGSTRDIQSASFYLEGSVDGFSWTRLFETNNVVSPGSGAWLSDRKKYAGRSDATPVGDLTLARTDTTKRRHGFTFPQPVVVGYSSEIKGFVSVKNGAELRSLGGRRTIGSFKIDMTSGGGTVNGFDFAESGTFSLVNIPDGGGNSKTASFTPVNCTGVENLSKWTLYVDGVASSKNSVSVSADGTVRLTRPAMRVIIR